MSSIQNASPADAQAQSPSSSLSFTQGFLVGQLSIALLIFCFIRFFIFGELPSSDDRASALFAARRARVLSHTRRPSAPLPPTSTPPFHRSGLRKTQSTTLRNPPPLTTASILAKTYYNVNDHQPESLDWFNVLVAQTLAQLRADALADSAILTSLSTLLNGPTKPSFLSEIKITEISLGDEFPIFSNCRVIPAPDPVSGGGSGSDGVDNNNGANNTRLQARMDVDLADFITLGVETKLVLNYPQPFSAVLPVALAVSVVRFSGTLSLSFVPTAVVPPSSPSPPTSNNPSDDDPPRPGNTTLTFSFLDDYRLDLSVTSLLGSRSRLHDIPKIAQLVEARLHAWFDERCVKPRFQQIVLPSFWPRKRTARGGQDAAEQGHVGGDGQGHERSGKEGAGTDKDKPLPRTPPRQRAEVREEEGEEHDVMTEEQRLAAEGDKIRQAERRAERGLRRERDVSAGDGDVRWRGPRGTRTREASAERERERGLGMPGEMPGGMVA